MPELVPLTNSPSSSYELLEKPTPAQILPCIGTPFATRLMTLLDHDAPAHYIDIIKDATGTGIMGYGPFNLKATWVEEAEEGDDRVGELSHRYRVFLARSTGRDAHEVFRYESHMTRSILSLRPSPPVITTTPSPRHTKTSWVDLQHISKETGGTSAESPYLPS
ncbi:hypothetical protein GALMADRAFT_131512 [Galerina marginata CBS 339.88]|uniref:Uncharacterized protein n=1 Tax=Galerina marginata (strain CBS 339.88) TaxID=685588 RepID=A0A067U058_GALM3|nr:hypothetical protein GALMADRAFT_131512 [Galerina marginata CBS 339.88]